VFEELPLEMEIRSAISMSGSLGTQDLKQTVEAAGVAFAVVWVGLIARYRAAGVFGLFLCIVFLWLQVGMCGWQRLLIKGGWLAGCKAGSVDWQSKALSA
jgi:preprotein translocase subunit SecD